MVACSGEYDRPFGRNVSGDPVESRAVGIFYSDRLRSVKILRPEAPKGWTIGMRPACALRPQGIFERPYATLLFDLVAQRSIQWTLRRTLMKSIPVIELIGPDLNLLLPPARAGKSTTSSSGSNTTEWWASITYMSIRTTRTPWCFMGCFCRTWLAISHS